MANIKFSDFTETATPAGVQYLVGYNGTQNVRIAPGNIGGAFLPLAGGTLTGALIVNAAATVNDLLTAGLGLALTGGTVGNAKLVLASTNKVHLSGGTAGLILQNSAGTKSLTIDTVSTFAGDVNVTGSLAATVNLTAAVYKSPTGVSLKLDSDGATGAELVGNAANTKSGSIRFNCEQNTHGVTLIGPPHSASATYTLTLPNATGSAGQVLSTNGSGVLSFITAAGGATSLNGLSDVSLTSNASGPSAFFINIPSSLASNEGDNIAIGSGTANSFTNAQRNIAIGNNALEDTTFGADNIAIGDNALANNQTRTGVIAIGTNTAKSGGTSPSDNITHSTVIGYLAAENAQNFLGGVALGFGAGRISLGQYALAIGYQSGRSNSATGHISIGYQAGYSNTSGTRNVYLGYRTGFSNTTSSFNTSVGYQAGAFNTGSYNVSIGTDAGRDHTGAKNVVIGSDAGSSMTTSDNNIVIGYDAEPSTATVDNEITLGDANITALRIPGLQSGASDGDVLTFASGTGLITLAAAGGGGASSLNGLTDCLVDTDSLYVGEVPAGLSGNPQGNTVLGIDAGNVLTSGVNNTLLGNDAGKTLTSGQKNIFLGTQAGVSTGSSVQGLIAIGYQASFSAQASNCIAIGQDSGRTNTGNGRMDIGYRSGYSNTSGSWNLNLGYFAAYRNTTSEKNTVIGTEAGFNNTGGSNTFLGYKAGYDQTTGSNNIVIGCDAEPSAVSATNEITLGDANVDLLRIPGLGTTDGHVLTFETASGGIVLKAAGGGGATSLNGLTDCLLDTGGSADRFRYSLYVGEVPAGLSGNPQSNTTLGILAGEKLTTGASNTFMGNGAGLNNLAGSFNVAIGTNARYTSQAGNFGVGVGYAAGYANNAYWVTAIGHEALRAGSGGNGSVGVGASAARANSAAYHVSIGYQAGYSNTSGLNNTNLGYQAGYSITANSSTTNIGYQAGYHNTNTGTTNIGTEAGKGLTGGYNTTLGYRAGYKGGSSQSGQYSVYIGALAAYDVAGQADNNTAVGGRAMEKVSTGSKNTCIGRSAGGAITTSPDNTFIGYQTGVNYNNTSGDGRNVGVGSTAAGALTTGIYNTFLGYGAGNGGGGSNATVTTGNFNTLVGYQAKGSSSAASNQNTFGYSAACTGNNQVTLGNGSIGTLRCQVTSITAISDERDKTDIETIPYGLDFIDSLQPKQFVWNHRPEIDDNGNEFFSANKGKKDIGFIAQDLQAVDDDYLNLVYDENPDKLEATYGRLIPVLVQAIKELKAEIELLKQ